MPKITVVGDVAVITSEFGFEELKRISKYRPEALCLKDEKGNKYFKVEVTEGGSGCISKCGISFNAKAHTGDEVAVLTYPIPNGVTDVAEWASDEFGYALLRLKEVEGGLYEALAAITAEKADIAACIEIA